MWNKKKNSAGKYFVALSSCGRCDQIKLFLLFLSRVYL